MILPIFDRQVTLTVESIGLSLLQKFKINFQDDDCSGHTGFPMKTNIAFFNLQVTQILPTKFLVNWPFGSGEEVQDRFLR